VLALAQASRDDMLASGAKALSAAELKETLTGAELVGPSVMGTYQRWVLKANGSLEGESRGWISGPAGEGISLYHRGKWTVNEQGQFCVEVQISTSGFRDTDKGCEDWYQRGTDFYAVRDGKIMKRSVKKA